MSSVLKSYSQIPVRAKYLIVIVDSNGGLEGVGNDGVSAFSLDPGVLHDLGSMALAGVVEDESTISFLRVGDLFKDLGRQITILDTDGATHLAVYRQVQLVDGPATEGVGGGDANGFNANIFLRVWAADGKNVVVVRTG